MLVIGKTYWFIPDDDGKYSGPRTDRVLMGQLLSYDHFGVSFLSGGTIYFTTVNDVFSNPRDADNEFYYRQRRAEKRAQTPAQTPAG